MRSEIPGFAPLAMALPYGSYGQCVTDDPHIPRFLGPWLATQFGAVFTGNPEQFTTRATAHYQLGRLIVTAHQTAPGLYAWLRALARPGAPAAPVCASRTTYTGG